MPKRWLRWLAALTLIPLLAACDFTGPQSALDPAGPVAQIQIDIFYWAYWLSWPVMIIVTGLIVYVIFRYRRRPGDEMPVQSHGNPMMEVVWTIIPVILVILVAVPTVRSVFATQSYIDATEEDVVVHVTGYQWWWKFEYPETGIRTANELIIPAGKRVVLQLNSADVLHAFWVPRLAGKVDLIPNQDNQLWFEADEPGEYPGQCAELCLGAHAYMRFKVIAVTEEEYEAWLHEFEQPEVAANPSDPVESKGRQLLAQKGCIGCHTVDNYAEGLALGSTNYPSLTNFGLRTSIGANIADATLEHLTEWIVDPQSMKPGNYMPTLWEEDDPNRYEEAEAIATYLLSLGAGDADVSSTASALGGN